MLCNIQWVLLNFSGDPYFSKLGAIVLTEFAVLVVMLMMELYPTARHERNTDVYSWQSLQWRQVSSGQTGTS